MESPPQHLQTIAHRPPSRGIHLAWSGILLLAMTGPGAAQSPLGDERQLFAPLPSVFAASRFEQPLTEAPSSVTLISAEDIRRHGYRTIADILGGARGFFVTGDRNYSYLGVRGFARSGDFNSRLLVQIDGHRVNDNVYGTASLGTEAIIDVALIDRVEIVRGPTSSLYGANAIFGTVNIVTRRGRDLNGTRVELGVGDRGTRQGQASTGGKLANGLEYLASVSLQKSNGDANIFFPELDAPANNNGVARNLDRDGTKRLFAKFQFEDTGFTAALSERKRLVPTASFSTVFNDPGNQTNDAQMFLELRQRADLAGGDVRARLYHDTYAYAGDFTYNRPPWLLNKDSTNGQWWGGDIAWSGRLNAAHRLSTGVEYRKSSQIQQRNYDIAINLDDRRKESNWGAFLQDEWTLAQNLTANLGLRYDAQSGRAGAWNPRAALNYRPRESTTLKFIQGSAYRPPNAYELHYTDGNATQKANPALRSESIRTTEVIWEERFASAWRASLGAYQYRIKNLVSQRTDPADSLLVFFNQGAISARGIEAEIQGRFKGGIEASASLAKQSSRDQNTGMRLTNSPRDMLKSRIVIPLPGAWHAGLGADYLSARRTTIGSTAAAMWLANLTLTQEKLLPDLRFSLNVQNLFDRRYGDPGAPEHVQVLIPQPGRSLLAKFEFQF